MKGLKYNLLVILFIFSNLLIAQNEAYYIDLIAGKMGAITEQKVKNGRVDIVTHTHAIEVEWATNWKHSIGQALWYGLQTNKTPGIILIMKDLDERKYGIMLQSAIDYAGMTDKIKVWFYPEDFGSSFVDLETSQQQYKQNLVDTYGNFTKNQNSGIRHNSKCTYFNCANCVPCGPNDGKKACGKCGG